MVAMKSSGPNAGALRVWRYTRKGVRLFADTTDSAVQKDSTSRARARCDVSALRRLSWLAILFLLACSRGRETAVETKAKLPPIILISIDTLRADHLPAYGYEGVATPAIDAFSADSIVFENAYSHCPLTLPSHVSMLSGRLPFDHGVRNNIGYRFDANSIPSAGTVLRSRGYRTGATVSAYVLRGSTGLRDAFEEFDDGIEFRAGEPLGDLARRGDVTVAHAMRWLAADDRRPPFLFLHLFEPHAPYEPSAEFRDAYASKPYDGEIATVDQILGTFIAGLKQRGLYDKALIILASDHGEGLGDHGEPEHGVFLYRESEPLPPLVKLPGSQRGGERVARPVQLIDILPTVCEVSGAALPSGLAGASLLFKAAPFERRSYSETMYPRIHLGMSELTSLIDSNHQLIDAPRPELFDIVADPGERRNIAQEERRVFVTMRKELGRYERGVEPSDGVDPEEARKLAALGYVGSRTTASPGLPRDPKDHLEEIEAMRGAARRAAVGDLPGAIAGFRAVIAMNPESTDAWTRLGEALEQSERYAEAAEAYRRALQLAPGLTEETALSLASIYLNQGRLDDAASHAELAMTTNPPAAHLLLGRVALARRDYVAAEAEAQASRSDEHFRMQSTVLLAQALTGQRRAAEAIALLEATDAETRGRGGRQVLLYEFARGDALAHVGRLVESEAAFRREIRLYPRDRQAYIRLAGICFLQGRTSEARTLLEMMVKANPGSESFKLAADTSSALGDEAGAVYWGRRLESAR